MSRSANSFGRGQAKFQQEKRILVLCEDSKSGKEYLEQAAAHFRAQLLVDVAHPDCTHPSGIVQAAIDRQDKHDEVYCVIDRDTHKCFNLALSMAKQHPKITLIKSFPCFEFWILIHFINTTKPYQRQGKLSPGACVIRDIRSGTPLKSYDKGKRNSYFSDLLGVPFTTARNNSPKILNLATQSGNSNPSTEVHLLIDRFESLSSPTPKNNGKTGASTTVGRKGASKSATRVKRKSSN